MGWVNIMSPETPINFLFIFSVKAVGPWKEGVPQQGPSLPFLQEGPNSLDFW